jgi:hypothetical protein
MFSAYAVDITPSVRRGNCPRAVKNRPAFAGQTREASKMKRFYKLLGIAALAAVIAIGLVGCPTDSDGNGGGGSVTFAGLLGTWKNDSDSSKTIEFGMVAEISGVECISIGGTAVYDGSPASTNPSGGTWVGLVDGWIGSFASGFRVAFEGGKLRISESISFNNEYEGIDGLYTKQ